MPTADPDQGWGDWFSNLFHAQPSSAPQPAGMSLNGYAAATPGVMAGPAQQPPQPQQGGYWTPRIIQGALSGIKSGLTLPGDVATGKINPTDPSFPGRRPWFSNIRGGVMAHKPDLLGLVQGLRHRILDQVRDLFELAQFVEGHPGDLDAVFGEDHQVVAVGPFHSRRVSHSVLHQQTTIL
jgi:hypothetical protein